MGKVKAATRAQAPIGVRRQISIDPTDSVPAKVITPPAKPPIDRSMPSRFTYALKAYTSERRSDGWYICRTPSSFAGEKPEWSGPFETVETAALAIARRLAIEIADRHTRSIEAHKVKPGAPLYGLKPTTRLHQKKLASTT